MFIVVNALNITQFYEFKYLGEVKAWMEGKGLKLGDAVKVSENGFSSCTNLVVANGKTRYLCYTLQIGSLRD